MKTKALWLCKPCFDEKVDAGTLPPGEIFNATGLVGCHGDHGQRHPDHYRRAVIRIEVPEEK